MKKATTSIYAANFINLSIAFDFTIVNYYQSALRFPSSDIMNLMIHIIKMLGFTFSEPSVCPIRMNASNNNDNKNQ